jgi:hypothetical protein
MISGFASRDNVTQRNNALKVSLCFVVWGEEPLALPLGCLWRAARRDWDGRAARRRRGKGHERGADNSGCEESPPGGDGKARRRRGANYTSQRKDKEGRGGWAKK